MYLVPLNLIFIYQVNRFKYFLDDYLILLSTGDVAGPYFWLGQNVPLTSDYLVYKTSSSAEAALLGFSTMIYDIIYMRQGHGGKDFDQMKLLELLGHTNIGN